MTTPRAYPTAPLPPAAESALGRLDLIGASG